MIFAPLYSEKTNLRPNAPVNIIVGALILKEFNHLSDDDIPEECECDFRYQYALHTTSFENQPISDRTFSRFRERVAAYELVTGEDLIHTCMSKLADHIAKFMETEPDIKRMDSMMIESNIKKMSRLELLYTCLSNLVKTIARDGNTDMIKELENYCDPNNRNKVVCYERKTPQSKRIQKVINDATNLIPKCKELYEENTDYQLPVRAINEQTKDDDDNPGSRIPKTSEDGMGACVLQNPSDPDATFRVKANKQHRGYVANLTETVDAKGSVITDYRYDVNTRSDVSFIKEIIEDSEVCEEAVAVITDGAYNTREIQEPTAGKNIGVLSTDLIGRKGNPIITEFSVNDNTNTITLCPEEHTPKSSSYIKQSNSIRESFHCEQCENCLRFDECKPAMKKRTAVKILSLNGRQNLTDANAIPNKEERKLIGRIRNGAETVPSIIRNKYGMDKMPVRGKLKTKYFFGFKVTALNFSKMLRFIKGKEKCRAFYPA